MKRMKMTILVVILMVLATFTIGIAAEESLIKNVKDNNGDSQPLLFDAEVTFIIQTSEGCGCDPIPNATVLRLVEKEVILVLLMSKECVY